MKKAGPIIVLFIILALPLVIYMYLRTATHVVAPLKIISEKIANPGGSPDSVYKSVGDFAFMDQSESMVTLDSFRNAIWVANVFPSDCPPPCPKVLLGIRDIQNYYRNFPDVRFLSICTDSVGAGPELLREYASEFAAMENKWFFITGPPAKLNRFARSEFGFGGAIDDTTKVFPQDNTLRLVDREGRFRGYRYDGARQTDVDSVISHIVLLQREYEQAR